MAIIHADNFSIYGTNTGFMTQGIYAQASGSMSLSTDPDGISGGYVLRQNSSAAAQAELRYVLPSTKTTVGSAIRLWMNILPTGSQDRPRVMSYRNGSNGETAYVIVETTGQLTFADGTNTITTAVPVISANGWWHIECKYVTSGSGSIEIRVEGITVLQDLDLGYVGKAPVSQVALHFFGNNFSGTVAFWKDFVLWDSVGTQNNDFISTVLVTTLQPLSDVALNWTPSTGTVGFSILDNIPPVDGTYISAPNPPPAAYQATLSNLPDDVTSVKALITLVRAAKTDGGDGSLQVSLISDPLGTADEVDGADRPITVAQTYWRDVFELDPKTSAPWTPTSVDNVDIKINRTL